MENTVHASIRLFLPFKTQKTLKFRKKLFKNPLWLCDDTESCFYLKYIDRIFNKNGIYSDCLIMKKDIENVKGTVGGCSVCLSSARIFSFDTSTAFLELKFLTDCASLNEVADISAKLRRTNKELFNLNDEAGIKLNDLADEILAPFGGYSLFDHLARPAETRAELFVSVVSDEALPICDADAMVYNISAGFNGSYNEAPKPSAIYSNFSHIRWSVTDKGVCAAGIKTENEKDNGFISSAFPCHADKRYIVWFIIALHLKYALYGYMNEIAEGSSSGDLSEFRKKIMELNTKYRFSIISEETSYQELYEKMCSARNLEQEFNDIDGEIERISEFYETEGQKNNTLAMTGLSILCGFSLIIDIYNLFFSESFSPLLTLAGFGGLALVMLYIIFPKKRICTDLRNKILRIIKKFNRN